MPNLLEINGILSWIFIALTAFISGGACLLTWRSGKQARVDKQVIERLQTKIKSMEGQLRDLVTKVNTQDACISTLEKAAGRRQGQSSAIEATE